MEEDIVHSSGMEKVVFLSTLDEPRNKSKISKIWNITVSGGPLYKKSTNRGIEYYQDKEILSKEGKRLTANLNSEAVKEDLKESLKDSSDINQYFKEDIDNFIEFLSDEKIINKLLTPQTIRDVFGSEKNRRLENVRDNKLTRYFELIATSSVKLWIDKESRSFFSEFKNSNMMYGMVKGMFSAIWEDVNENSALNVDLLYQELEELYEEDPESVSYLIESYGNIVDQQINEALS